MQSENSSHRKRCIARPCGRSAPAIGATVERLLSRNPLLQAAGYFAKPRPHLQSDLVDACSAHARVSSKRIASASDIACQPYRHCVPGIVNDSVRIHLSSNSYTVPAPDEN